MSPVYGEDASYPQTPPPSVPYVIPEPDSEAQIGGRSLDGVEADLGRVAA